MKIPYDEAAHKAGGQVIFEDPALQVRLEWVCRDSHYSSMFNHYLQLFLGGRVVATSFKPRCYSTDYPFKGTPMAFVRQKLKGRIKYYNYKIGELSKYEGYHALATKAYEELTK